MVFVWFQEIGGGDQPFGSVVKSPAETTRNSAGIHDQTVTAHGERDVESENRLVEPA